MTIKERIDDINLRLTAAAKKSGRSREDILLLAVSKTVEPDRIKEAVALGLTELGENKPQEICRKFTELEGVKWHQIGHLQTNKVRSIIDKVCLIHSVDSLKLAEEIDKRAAQHDIVMPILIEINIGDEESKHGVSYDEAEALVYEIAELEHIIVKGLMCVAPYVENPEQNRELFAKMRKLFIDIGAKNIHNVNMEYLSMGMTNDYEVAVEEGANIVRIGTGIFGARDYH